MDVAGGGAAASAGVPSYRWRRSSIASALASALLAAALEAPPVMVTRCVAALDASRALVKVRVRVSEGEGEGEGKGEGEGEGQGRG